MNTLPAAWTRLRGEFAGNARLRWGIWAILAIALVYAALLQSERRGAVHREYAAEAERLARAQTLLGRQDWPQRLESEREAHAALAARLWQAETPGLAQAGVQAALGEIIRGLNLRNPRIRPGASQAVPEAADMWRVQVRLNASYAPGEELQVLHAVSTYPKKLVVDKLDLHRRSKRLSLILSAYFVGVRAPSE